MRALLKILAVTGVVLVLVVAGLAVWAAVSFEDRLSFPDTPAPALAATDDPATIERGRYLVHGPAHCAQCHSTAVLSYLRSLAPVKHEVPPGDMTLVGKMVVAYVFPSFSPRTDAPAFVPAGDEPSVERGRCLAESVMLCTLCHTRFDPVAFKSIGEVAGGGSPQPSESDPGMEYVPPNLTAHPTGYTGKVEEDAFVKRMRAGRAYRESKMPWENVAATTESDLRSVYRYLRRLPPIDHDVGPTFREAT